MTTSTPPRGFYSYNSYKIAAVFLLAGLWLLSPSLCVQADNKTPHGKPALTAGKKTDTAQVRKEIQAVYDQQSAALNRKDVPGFLALCTPDYQDLARGKRLFPAGYIRQALPRTLAKYSTLQMTATIKTLKVKGSQATVTATHHVKVTFLPRYAAGAPVRSSETVTEDIWVKTDKGWRTRRSKEIDYKRQAQQLSHPPTTAKPVIEKKAALPAQ